MWVLVRNQISNSQWDMWFKCEPRIHRWMCDSLFQHRIQQWMCYSTLSIAFKQWALNRLWASFVSDVVRCSTKLLRMVEFEMQQCNSKHTHWIRFMTGTSNCCTYLDIDHQVLPVSVGSQSNIKLTMRYVIQMWTSHSQVDVWLTISTSNSTVDVLLDLEHRLQTVNIKPFVGLLCFRCCVLLNTIVKNGWIWNATM